MYSKIIILYNLKKINELKFFFAFNKLYLNIVKLTSGVNLSRVKLSC